MNEQANETRESKVVGKVHALKNNSSKETNDQDVKQTEAITNALIEEAKTNKALQVELKKMETEAAHKLAEISNRLDEKRFEMDHKIKMTRIIVRGIENVALTAGVVTVLGMNANMKKSIGLEKIRQGEV